MLSSSECQPTSQDVVDVYKVMLGREPESRAAIEDHLHVASTLELMKRIAGSNEFLDRANIPVRNPSPFLHINTSIDVEALIRRNVNADRKPVEDATSTFSASPFRRSSSIR